MDALPVELLELILLCLVRKCHAHKSQVFPARFVCKAFDKVLRPYVLKTIRFDMWQFLKDKPTPDSNLLPRIGGACEALHLDMMLLRDDKDLAQLTAICEDLTSKIPEVGLLVDTSRSYSMSPDTFDENDFRRALQNVLDNTPNMSRLKFNLPCSTHARPSRIATLLLATMFDCLSKRHEECKPLEILVLSPLSDQTLIDICSNPIDLRNAITAFSHLKSLVLTINRCRYSDPWQRHFNKSLWFIIRKATKLENLYIQGRPRRNQIRFRRHTHDVGNWRLKSLPYYSHTSNALTCLRAIHIHHTAIRALDLISLIEETSSSLKELYLSYVKLQVICRASSVCTDLWMGLPSNPCSADACWVAEALCAIPDLKLDILRATSLGYDVYQLPNDSTSYVGHDLDDPSGFNVPFDQRFVEAVMCPDAARHQYPPAMQPQNTSTSKQPASSSLIIGEVLTGHEQYESPAKSEQQASSTEALTPFPRSLSKRCRKYEYDAESYLDIFNTTATLRYCIDGYFRSNNNEAQYELWKILTVLRTGAGSLTAEIARAKLLRIEEGKLVDGPIDWPL